MKSCAHKVPTEYSLSKNQRSENDIVEKVIKIDSRITSKPHAHLHTMQKTSEKFQKNQWKTVRGNASTRYPVYFHLKGQLNLGDSIISLLKI